MKRVDTISAADVGRALDVSRQAVAQSIRRDTTVADFDARPYAVTDEDGKLVGFRADVYEAIDHARRPEPVAETATTTVVGNSDNSVSAPVMAGFLPNPTPVPALSGWPAMGTAVLSCSRDVLVAETPQAARVVDALADNLPVLLALGGALAGALVAGEDDRLAGAALGAGVVLLAQMIHRPVAPTPAPVVAPASPLSASSRRLIASLPITAN
jgi:hypothetical protein